jgi:hypothetical protein
LNDGQIPNLRGVRVALGTGYRRVERNRRAWVSSPTRNPLTSRFAPVGIAVRQVKRAAAEKAAKMKDVKSRALSKITAMRKMALLRSASSVRPPPVEF